MAFFDTPSAGDGKEGELKLVTVGAAVAVGAFLLISVLKNRNAATSTATTAGAPGVAPLPSAAGAQANTVYLPVSGPSDTVETIYTNSYNQNSPVTDTTGQSTSSVTDSGVTSPVTTITTPAPVIVPPVIVPPTPIPVPPTPIQPWWYGLLHNGPGGRSYYTSQGETTNAMASKFHLKNGWTDIGYNPHNQGIENGTFLSQAYNAHGNNVIPAGTEVWITTSTIQ